MARIGELDLLRGVAIMGTLGTNIWLFTNPGGPAVLFDVDAGAVETFLRFLTNGKFLGLLTLLFGIGLEFQYRSAARRGARWPGRYLWRAALLFTEGLLHYLLIFEADVLMAYAVIAMLVAYLIGRSDRAVRRWMVAMGSVHLAMVALLTAALLAGGGTIQTTGTTLYAEGSWLEQVASRIQQAPAYRFETLFILPMGVVMFLAGAKLMRAGAFEHSGRGARLRRRLMAVGLGAALPLNLLTSFGGEGWFFVDRYLLAPLVAAGLLGLIVTVAGGMGPAGRLRGGITNVGRMALSCYVFQNLAAATICYGWGLGLAVRFADLRPWWVIGAWAGICALFMTLSSLWLRRFDRGPLELAWNWAYHLPRRADRQSARA